MISSQSLFLLFLAGILCLSQTVHATKHLFHTKRDHRYFIGPIGGPFGFSEGGSISLAVYDYQMTSLMAIPKKKADKGGSGLSFIKPQKSGPFDDDDDDMDNFNGVFFLKRFKTESEFLKYEEEIFENPTKCLYNQIKPNEERRSLLGSFDDDANVAYYNYGGENQGIETIIGHFDDNIAHDDMVIDGWINEPMYGNDDFEKYYLDLEDDTSLDSAPVYIPDVTKEGIFLSMEDKKRWQVKENDIENPGVPMMKHTFTANEEGLYFLMFQVCPASTAKIFSRAKFSFKLKLQTQNIDSLGRISFLTAGELHLPLIFFFFSIVYAVLSYIWHEILTGGNKRKIKINAKAVHHLMTAILMIKALSMLFESIRYHFISTKGHAEFWSFLYYSITFVKSVLLFSVILLLGSGWSLMRPFLHQREKIIIFFVLSLQILNNVAVIFILSDTEGERQYKNWSAIAQSIDVFCCLLVLIPLIWQVSNLEASSQTAEEKRTIKMLKLFKSFYLLVVGWIYFTRVIVYLVAAVLSYKFTWVSTFLTEIVTIIFFVITGYFFYPEAKNEVSSEKISRDDDGQNDAECGSEEPLFNSDEKILIPGAKHNTE